MVKSFIFNSLFYLITALFVIIGSPLLLGPRSWAMAGLRAHARTCLWMLKVIIGLKYEIRGLENLPQAPYLVASKHQSPWETFALIPLFKDPVTIQKAELFLIPFHGWFSKKFGMIGVKRSSGPTALRHMISQAKDRVAKNREIIIFPEGSRMTPGNEPQYKPGIIKLYEDLNLPCVPVALNSGLFWPRKSSMRYAGTIIVEFLPSIEPGLARKDFKQKLQNQIEEATYNITKEAATSKNPPHIPLQTKKYLDMV